MRKKRSREGKRRNKTERGRGVRGTEERKEASTGGSNSSLHLRRVPVVKVSESTFCLCEA